ncbi:GNAT family N-acetyltransferase [Kandleria vitulina]|uniref:GNAT family N-acetyltransferase n=1 Tax=Kandleria vitulina TaxID=1630 RepID=UPI0039B632C2
MLKTRFEIFVTEQLKAKKIYLEVQEYVIGYYAKEGFEVVSEPFMEDGIPHVKMERAIEKKLRD